MKFLNQEGIQGQGKDIKWCDKNNGGKRCQLCRHYVEHSIWSKAWFFYYLNSWTRYDWDNWREFAYNKIYPSYKEYFKPVKYHTTGLEFGPLKSLLLYGCKSNRKCKCIALIQRGHWYCPECWFALNTLAKMRNQHPHDLMLVPRQELKGELLILKLSGIL